MQSLSLPQQSICTSALEHMAEVADSIRGIAETASSPSPPSTLPAPWTPNGSAAAFSSNVLFFKGKATANIVLEGRSLPCLLVPLLLAALQLKNANWEMDLKYLKFCLSII